MFEAGDVVARRPAIRIDWALLTRITLLWFACYVAALVLDPNLWVVTWRGLIESVVWLVILALPASSRRLSTYLNNLPRRHKRFLAAVMAALLFGQLAGWQPERTFPLVSWRMFRTKTVLQPFSFFEYVGQTADGGQLSLNPPRLFPSLKNSRLMVGLSNLAGTIVPTATSQAPTPSDLQRLSSALRALGRMHNRLNPVAPILVVSVVHCTLDPRAPRADRQVQRKRVWTVSIAGEQ